MSGHMLLPRDQFSNSQFSWVFLLWYSIFGILTLFFLFYFNRLIATFVSFVVRIYTWHYYRVYVDIQALQVSPLAGRLFFKCVRYYGRNESILIQDGHITWRYWLRRVQDIGHPGLSTQGENGLACVASSDGDLSDGRTAGEEPAGRQHANRLPCRLLLKARGVQWFIYNRSPAYDAIYHSMLGKYNVAEDGSRTTNPPGAARSSEHSSQSSAGKDETSPQEHQRDDDESGASVESGHRSITTKSTAGQSLKSDEGQTRALPSLLNILPIGVECGKAAIAMGNQSTRSILVAKVDSASGEITARPPRSIDLYKQVIDFDFTHPTVQFKHNKDYKDTPYNKGAKLYSSRTKGPAPQRSWYNPFNPCHRLAHTSGLLRRFFPNYRAPVNSSEHPCLNSSEDPRMQADNADAYGQTKWLGLMRYLDDESEMLEQERWKSIEYAQLATIVDCPAISMSFSWDVPGVVPHTSLDFHKPPAPYEMDINSDVPPDWSIELKVRGGLVNYGPWADRQRVDIQTAFFPPLYQDAMPANPLAVGATRISTELKIILIFDEQVTLRVPTREESKDWKWKGQTSASVAVDSKQNKKTSVKGKKHADASQASNMRPFGWIDLKVSPDSTIHFVIDLVARPEGYRNRVEVDLKGLEMSSSVNHALFLKSQSQTISCNLSNPLGWNSLRKWGIDIHDQSLELFLLRDHIFLITDLIGDWTSGPPGEFHTFVPFEYSISSRFKDFRLYLNANDSNIVDNPADVSDNSFLVIWGEVMIADISIPATSFCPSRKKVEFNVQGRDGGFELILPAWNTQHTFLEGAQVAALKDLKIVGSHNYFTSISPTLTDTLLMDVSGESARIQLYGFLLRYMMNIKENYFGEDMHFRTLEEYQRQLGSVEQTGVDDPSAEHHKRPSNDLDVVLAIKTTGSYVMLPANLYSAAESIKLDIQSVSADLRITNYYMDLAILFSPVSLSRASKSKRADRVLEENSMTQVFIDGLEILGHRLFGLPPSEPTYVCNWDFEIGDVSGECSIDFLRDLVLAVQCFALSFTDDENALPHDRHAMVHDVTFLRANMRSFLIALRVEQAALLLGCRDFRVDLSDCAGPLFSDRLHASIPDFTLAIIDSRRSHEEKSAHLIAVATHAYLKTSVEFHKVRRRHNFQGNRLLQQSHVALHDSRTHRVPWLSQAAHAGKPLSTSAKVRAPAMPFPFMPSPLYNNLQHQGWRDPLSTRSTLGPFSNAQNYEISSVASGPTSRAAKDHNISAGAYSADYKSSKNDLRQSTSRFIKGLSSPFAPFEASPKGSRPNTTEGKEDKRDCRSKVNRSGLGFSSPYQRPHFPLLSLVLDLDEVPQIPSILTSEDKVTDEDVLEQLRVQVPSHDAEQVSFFIRIGRGLQALCKPEALVLVTHMQDQLQTDDIVSLLDNVQIDAMRDVLNQDKKRRRGSRKTEIKLSAPFLSARFVSPSESPLRLFTRQEQYDVTIDNLTLTTRLLESVPNEEQQPIRDQLTMHILVHHINCSARECTYDSLADEAVISLRVHEPMLWFFQDREISAELNFDNIEIASASRKVDYISSLIRQTALLSEDLARRFSSIARQRKSRLRLLLLLLAKEGDSVADPPFLAGASYVLRSARDHLRTSDSWRMISHLRYVYLCLPGHDRDRIHAQCVHRWAGCPEDASKMVTAFFEKWRNWDLANVGSSLLMQRVYGELLGPSRHKVSRRRAIKASIRGIKLLIVVDPGACQNDITIDRCLFGIAFNQTVQEGSSLSRRVPLDTIHAHCVKIAARLNWSLCDLLENIVETVRSIPRPGVGKTSTDPTAPQTHANSCLHVLLSSEVSVLDINTINLKAVSICQLPKASIMRLRAPDALAYGSFSLVIDADTLRSEVYSQATMLTVYSLQRPRVLGTQGPSRREESGSPWKFVGYGRKVSFQVAETPLDLAEAADNFLQKEAAHLKKWLETLSNPKGPHPSSKKTQGTSGPPKAHVGLFLDSYHISVAVLPSLVYQIHGGGIRSFVVSGLPQHTIVSLDLDMEQQTHIFSSDTNDGAMELSTLQIPPINGHLKLEVGTERRMVICRCLVEHINLTASSVHAILDAVNQPAIISLTKDIQHEVLLIQQHCKLIFDGKESRNRKKLSSSPPLLYDANATIAGLTIHAKTRDSLPLGQDVEMELDLGGIHIQATNIDSQDGILMEISEFQVQLNDIMVHLRRLNASESHPCGNFSVGVVLTGTSKANDDGTIVRVFLVEMGRIDVNIFADTPSAMVAILGHLQGTLKSIDLPIEVKSLRKLGRERLRRERIPSTFHMGQGESSSPSTAVSSAIYSLMATNVRVAWKGGDSVLISPTREPQDLILSFRTVHLATKQGNAARLLVEDCQLQMAPRSQAIGSRSLNSALLPEVIFNVAYKSTKQDRKLAFQVVGKSLDLQLTSQFVLPANDLRRSIAFGCEQLQAASARWKMSTPVAKEPKKSMFGNKKLSSLLVYADFGGAVVNTIGCSMVDPPLNVLRTGRLPQHGRYNQFTSEDSSNGSATLRAPGVAVKVEYKDAGIDAQTLNVEMKISASSNVLFPSVVPLVMEISSCVKAIMAEDSSDPRQRRLSKFSPMFIEDEKLRTTDPSALLGNCKLNLGLRICRQEFSLSCQPIARVTARARFENIYVTISTVRSHEQGKFITVAATFSNLQMSVQHVYSRESTGSFDVDSIIISFINSKHLKTVNGISAILKISPMKVQVNAKQLQDFLLFRDIWIPSEIRHGSPVPKTVATSEHQVFIMQRYKQIAATGAFPWHATISITELDIQLDLGQSLGKPAFKVSKFWVASGKSSDWKQNLCVGFERVAIECSGRMSGIVELQNLKVRTSIQWPISDRARDQTPLVQASLGLDHLQVKAGFDYQTFLVADISMFDFLLYNVTDLERNSRDRLLGVLEGDKVQIFCTATSASQAYSLYQTFQRLVEEKQKAYEASLIDVEKFLRRKSSINPIVMLSASSPEPNPSQEVDMLRSPLRLQTNVVVTLKAVNLGAFPGTFIDSQIFKIEALEASARFMVVLDHERIHSTLGITLGQLRVALSAVNRVALPKTLDDISIADIVASATGSRGGTILKVPQVVATMQTWQGFDATHIDYIFKSSFQGKVDVGWNYSRITYIRGLYANHTRTLAQRLGKALPQSAVQITGLEEEGQGKASEGGQEKITAVVNVPQSKYQYNALQPIVIETPQLRDMGEATPPLEWIGLNRDRLPNLTHQIVIVPLLEVAKEVDEAYLKILGSS
ncbi:MAG: hypothetical protein Q9163_000972 [Psora crenata]